MELFFPRTVSLRLGETPSRRRINNNINQVTRERTLLLQPTLLGRVLHSDLRVPEYGHGQFDAASNNTHSGGRAKKHKREIATGETCNVSIPLRWTWEYPSKPWHLRATKWERPKREKLRKAGVEMERKEEEGGDSTGAKTVQRMEKACWTPSFHRTLQTFFFPASTRAKRVKVFFRARCAHDFARHLTPHISRTE